MSPIKVFVFRIKCCLATFLWVFFRFHKNHQALVYEMRQWEKVLGTVHYKSDFLCFIRMCAGFREYRSLLLLRLGDAGMILSGIVPHQRSTFFITESSKIGKGLILQHGYSSILFPESMGDNCQVWHNVTIGRTHDKGPRPIIGNNVKICAGSFVLGGIKVGDNVTVGAGTMLVKDVPENCVVCGNPAYIIKQDREKVHIKL